jgi:Acyl-CoA dehydrogenase, C-terminal domain
VTIIEDADELFLSSAQEALRGTSGDGAMEALGWRDLLESVDEVPDARLGVFAFFQAQGRELGSSRALGELMAHPYGSALGEARALTATVERRSAQRGSRCVVVGEPSGGVLIDRPGQGIALAELEALDLRPIGLSDGLVLHEVESDLTSLPMSLNEAQAVPLRSRSTQLGRVALAYEMLGAAEVALAAAVQYASDRKQFGQPIGHFQAVRHLLASARVDAAALASLARQSADQYPALPSMRDAILKALAGRNGKRICEKSLQVLGAIGFTAEHEHHRFHSRVLVLDSLLGTSSTLTHQIAVTLRASAGTVPDLYPSAGALRGN